MKLRPIPTAGAIALIAAVVLSVFGASIDGPQSKVLAQSSRSTAAKGTFNVGLVADVGTLNDRGFNHLAYIGMLAAEKAYGVKGHVVVSNSSADYVPNLTNYASAHDNLVIAVGFDMANAIYQVAKQYPHVHFALIDGAPANAKGVNVNLKNVANIFFREQQSGYLVGVIAGLMEKHKVGKAKTNTIAYMGGQSIPPVNRYIAGYVAGAQKVDRGIHFLGNYSNSFTDQSKAHGIGLAQIGQGATILFQVAGASGLGYLSAAQQKGVYGIGVDANQDYLGSYMITSALKKVNVAVKDVIRQTQTGHFKGGNHEFNLKNHATGFAPPTKIVPRYIVKIANRYAKKIAKGKIVPPTTIPKH